MTESNQTPKQAIVKVDQLLREARYIVESIQKNEILSQYRERQLRELNFLIEKAKHQSTYSLKYWDEPR